MNAKKRVQAALRKNTHVLNYGLKSIFYATHPFERLFVNSCVYRTLTHMYSDGGIMHLVDEVRDYTACLDQVSD